MAGLYREYQRVADHPRIAARAKAAPGQWQHVGVYRDPESARSTATHVRRAHLAAYAPAGAFQAYRSLDDGRCLWVRYVHGITPSGDLPEEMPETARLVMTAYAEAGHFVSAQWAADLLAAQGHEEAAALLRGWLGTRRGRRGPVGPREAAAYLIQHDRTTRKDTVQ